jgi:hypothetical protein
MNDDYRAPDPHDRVDARTSRRVAEMSDAERAELAREISRRKRALPEAPVRRYVPTPDARPSAKTPDDGHAEAVARLTAQLRDTQRHLDRFERSVTASRYGGGSSGPGAARHAFLQSRADRLERLLRKLR